ncbi:FAD-dependent monooxygenase [Streptomyces gilvosporeus]|uniref:Monooxygenase n=1 Tax=Streptomyces gilvosporeus TaxID=553510 RepID=A0A1V0TXV0_9ACTN|nr:FAD-dependent monooxygenase [Streptomyces gilvosporeus]ARF57776.1 monooxygenase [Streptomyces gilvosporeus]
MDPVIVVGAGPVGLCLALSLTRRGVPVVVLDESTGQDEVRPARTAVLRPDTAAALTRLGCGDTLASEGTRWTAWRTVRRRRLVDRVAFAPRIPDDAASPALASPLHVPQHALTRALRAALAREKLAQIATGSRLAELEQDEHGVSAHTRGPNGTWWRGSYLVGCDGPRSTVRKLLEIRFPGRTAVERHAVAALRTELPWPGEALLHRWPGRHGGGSGNTAGFGGPVAEIAARPLPDGVWRLDWLLPPGRDLVTPDALVARVRESLAGWAAAGEEGGRGDALPVPPYALLDTGVHTVHHRLAKTWRQGRAFLAGDAAHLLGALGTQGLDEGLRDAGNLAWKLGLAWHHGGSETLLDSYQAERRDAVAARLRATDQALPLLRDGRAARWRTVLPGTARGQSALLTDAHLGRGPLGAPPAYPRTPLAAPTGQPGTVAVGTRPGAPVADVPVTAGDGSVVRLRDRLGHGLLVVLVAPGTGVWDRRHWQSAGLMPQLTAAAEALPMPAEILVTESYPGAPAHTVLVVRPDGHLVTAHSGVRPAELSACADAVRGGGGFAYGDGAGYGRRAWGSGEAGDSGASGGSGGAGASGTSSAADTSGASGTSGAAGAPGDSAALHDGDGDDGGNGGGEGAGVRGEGAGAAVDPLVAPVFHSEGD